MTPAEVVLLAAAYIIIKRQRKKRKKTRRWWVRKYLQRKNNSVFSELSVIDGSFKNFTRMSSTDFEILMNMIGPTIYKKETKFRNPVSASDRLAVTLRYLASGDSYMSLSYTFRISRQLIGQIVPEVCKALIQALKDQIKIPGSSEQWKDKAEHFKTLWNFPNCVGAIDGKHILKIAPPNSCSDYFNYKGHFSIVLLAIADANYNFIYVNCGAKGKSSDSGVYQETTFYKKLNENNLDLPPPTPIARNGPSLPFVFVGDSAFALSQNMMKPYPGIYERGNIKRIFNYRLSRCRRIIENVFRVMSVVFRILRRPIELDPKNAEVVLMACAHLHNFLRRNSQSRTRYNPPGMMDYEDVNNENTLVEGSWRNELCYFNNVNIDEQPPVTAPTPQSAFDVRDRFAEYFCSEEGSVSWQNNTA